MQRLCATLSFVPPQPSTPVQSEPMPHAPDASVTCVVVNWNRAALTVACLDALAQQTYRNLVVVVVDNGSSDDSVERLTAWLAGHASGTSAVPVHLLQTGKNLGFAGGNNAGIQSSAAGAPDFVWLLNNDTVAPPDTLAKLVLEASVEPNAGMVGTVMHDAHDPPRVQAWGGGHINPNTAYAWHFTAPQAFGRNDYLTFASVLLRASMLRQIGLLDERFFMYFEDVELCLRARRAGWIMTVAADTDVLHYEGGSDEGGSSWNRPSLAKEQITTASALLLIRLYGTSPHLGTAVFLLRRLAKRILQRRVRAALTIVRTAWSARFY